MVGPDERLRAAALELWPAWTKKHIGKEIDLNYELGNAVTPFHALEFATYFAKEREDSAMREAAGLVCDGCKHNAVVINVDGGYFHLANGQYVGCVAAPIHERLALKEKE